MLERISRFVNEKILGFLPKGHPWDYFMHFGVSFIGVFALLFFLKSVVGLAPRTSFFTALGIMLGLGIAKEMLDAHIGKTDMIGDMTGNLLGIGAAILIILLAGKMTT